MVFEPDGRIARVRLAAVEPDVPDCERFAEKLAAWTQQPAPCGLLVDHAALLEPTPRWCDYWGRWLGARVGRLLVACYNVPPQRRDDFAVSAFQYGADIYAFGSRADAEEFLRQALN